MVKDIFELKTDLLCEGLRVDKNERYYKDIVPSSYPIGGKSRAGVAGSGGNFVLENGEACNIGVLQPFLEKTPFEFKIVNGQGWILRNGEKSIKATIRKPNWHSTELFDVIQLHGKDSLATAISNDCIYWKAGEGCKFCIISVGQKQVKHEPEEVAKAIYRIEDEPELTAAYDIEDVYNLSLSRSEREKRKKHIAPADVNINSGTLTNGLEVYRKTILAIARASDLPIGIQICPIKKQEIEELYSAGATEVSFNLEVYDERTRREVIPGKARDNSLNDYLRAMREAVKVFGENQVESWILIGLEPKTKTIEGIRAIAETGAIPLPKIFRPLYGSAYQMKEPPPLEEAIEIYKAWSDIVRECGLDPLETKAGCGRCNGCFPLREIIRGGQE
jgi:hypothetical protein